jgi:hypothetical protein
MRWDFVIEHWITRLQADAALVSLMNSSVFVFPGQAFKAVKIPSIEYSIVGDREEELFNPIQVQVDFWQRGIKKAAQTERRIRMLTHSDVGQDLAGERLWMRYLDSRTTEYPAELGVVHKVLDFLFEPMREKYVA